MLFVDASQEFEAAKVQNQLRDEDVQKIASTFHAFKDVDRYARVVLVEELEQKEFNLSISRYVDTAQVSQVVDVREAVLRLRQIEAERAEAEARMNALLRELGLAN